MCLKLHVLLVCLFSRDVCVHMHVHMCECVHALALLELRSAVDLAGLKLRDQPASAS